jgi:hypothetical protein
MKPEDLLDEEGNLKRDDALKELRRLRKIAVRKGKKDYIELIDKQIAMQEFTIKDEADGIRPEILTWGRNVAKGATASLPFGLNVTDETFAKVRALGGGDPIEEMRVIREQARQAEDNGTAMMGGYIVGGLAQAAAAGNLVGVGKTIAGTMARQGALGAYEGAMSTYNMSDSDLSSKKDVVEIVNGAITGGVLGGGVGGLTMGKSVDWGTTPSGAPMRQTKDGGRTVLDDIADEELDAVTLAGRKAQPQVTAATDQAEALKNRSADNPFSGFEVDPRSAGRNAMGRDEYNAIFEGLDDNTRRALQVEPRSAMSLLDDRPWTNAKRQELNDRPGWREASNVGELVDAVKGGVRDFYNNQLSPTTFRLMAKVSPQVGARYQIADQSALMAITKEFEQHVEPLARKGGVLDLNVNDQRFQDLLLDYAADSRHVRRKDVLDYVRRELGEEDAQALNNYLNYSMAKSQNHLGKVTGSNADLTKKNHLHTQVTAEKLEKINDIRKQQGLKPRDKDELTIPDDPATKPRERNWIYKPDPANPNRTVGSDYKPVLLTDMRRHMNNERLVQIAEKMKMPLPEGLRTTDQFFSDLTDHMVSKGINRRAAEQGTEWIVENIMGQTRSPHLWIQGMNSLGYFGSLAGPKSALLNLHDPALGVVNFDVPLREMIPTLTMAYKRAYKGEGLSAKDSGIQQSVGEFVNRHMDTLNNLGDKQSAAKWWADNTRELTDGGMKVAQFERLDMFSKNATLNVILSQLAREAKEGTLQKNWGFYMDPSDFGRLQNALVRGGDDIKNYTGKDFKLVEDLSFAALGQQQLISGAGRPAGWSRNPNMRPMWALRGFALQQQGIAMKRVLDAMDEGDMSKAYEYLGKYAVIAGGSFGLINETRQWLMGDGNFELTGILMGMADQMVSTASVNTIGMNDYQWGRMMENGIAMTFMESLVPIAVDIPLGMLGDVSDTLSGQQGALYPLAELPIIKQPIQFAKNMTENAGNFATAATLGQVDASQFDRGLLGVQDPENIILKKMGLVKDRS